MGFLIFLGVVLYIVISFIVASEFASIANKKGHDGTKYFWYTFLLGIIGALMVVALPDRNSNINIVHNSTDTNKENYVDNINNLTRDVVPNITVNSNDIKSDTILDTSSREKSVTFKTTNQNTIICSSCGFEQPAGRAVCWKCGCKFSKEDKVKQ